MNTVSFEINASSSDMLKASYRKMWLSKVFRIYFSTIFIVFVVGIMASHFFEESNIWPLFWVVCLVLLFAPYSLVRGIHRGLTKRSSFENKTYEVNADSLIIRSNEIESKIQWSAFVNIEETKSDVFLKLKQGGYIVFIKDLIKGTKTDEIIEALKSTGVPLRLYNKKNK